MILENENKFEIWLEEKIDEENRLLETNYRNNNYYRYDKEEKRINFYQLIAQKTGGNCWGKQTSTEFFDERVNPDFFWKLCLLLNEKFFLKAYKEIEEKINISEKKFSEYYGNGRDYKIHALKVEDVFNIMEKYLLDIEENHWKFIPQSYQKKQNRI